ncbi:hypothetical protein QVD17_41649 [Tagetes erecta]|uniref:Uncharacterized protein n=1 Tax=Tagetes erecta TaxID=13708 RepID=A0AAD8JKV4_TARER|nr:hypothetical protein QVD17_41649 [Tagetes erecta]
MQYPIIEIYFGPAIIEEEKGKKSAAKKEEKGRTTPRSSFNSFWDAQVGEGIGCVTTTHRVRTEVWSISRFQTIDEEDEDSLIYLKSMQ